MSRCSSTDRTPKREVLISSTSNSDPAIRLRLLGRATRKSWPATPCRPAFAAVIHRGDSAPPRPPAAWGEGPYRNQRSGPHSADSTACNLPRYSAGSSSRTVPGTFCRSRQFFLRYPRLDVCFPITIYVAFHYRQSACQRQSTDEIQQRNLKRLRCHL
jgi:hypothetical protein